MTNGKTFVRQIAVGLCMLAPWLAGCAAFHPMNGVPARYIPEELKIGHRNGKKTIDVSLLSQSWNGVHLVDSGDILGIYIGGILGKVDENPPVQLPQNSDFQPAVGVPVAVREDGTISLPMVGSILVRGKTTRETEDLIRQAYTNGSVNRELLIPGQERILVSLQRARHTRVLVIRQDSRTEPLANAAAGLLNIGTAKRGQGKVVSLPAYRNDVLNALVATDGLPGLDAENAVYVIRRKPGLAGQEASWPGCDPAELIRQSHKADTPVIRGQSPASWNYRTQNANDIGNRFTDPSGDYRRNPVQQAARFGSNQPMNLSRNLPQPGYSQGQAAIDAQGEDPMAFDEGELRGGLPPVGVDPAGYQNNPTWGSQPGTSPWNNGRPGSASYSPTPINGYSPTPLNNGGSAPFNPSIPQSGATSFGGNQSLPPAPGSTLPTPLPSYPPQPGGPAGAINQPGWTETAPSFNTFPNGAANLPGPGHSVPMAQPQPPTLIGEPNAALPSASDAGENLTMHDIGLVDGHRIIRIPIRLGPDEQVDIKREDIILHDGDIVFIESRDTEVFFTGGLLGGGQFTLPRDFDLDILEALSIATSRSGAGGAARQIGGVSALNSDVTISPSNVVIIRRLPEGGEVPIKIDLYKARNDPSERLYVQPGDYIYLQYTPCEAVAAFFERHLLEGAIFGVFAQSLNRTN